MAEKGAEGRGVCCPRCGRRSFRITHTEPLPDGQIRRRKFCRYCRQKVVTFEGTLAALRELIANFR